jgi:hypothetical protein
MTVIHKRGRSEVASRRKKRKKEWKENTKSKEVK